MKANAQGVTVSNGTQPGEIGTLRMGRKTEYAVPRARNILPHSRLTSVRE